MAPKSFIITNMLDYPKDAWHWDGEFVGFAIDEGVELFIYSVAMPSEHFVLGIKTWENIMSVGSTLVQVKADLISAAARKREKSFFRSVITGNSCFSSAIFVAGYKVEQLKEILCKQFPGANLLWK